jgi:hypothetical protein
MAANTMIQYMFYKEKISLPAFKSTLAPAIVADYLIKAAQLAGQIGFEWVFVDKPVGSFLDKVKNRWLYVCL